MITKSNLPAAGSEMYENICNEEARLRMPVLDDVNCLNFIVAAAAMAAYAIIYVIL